MGLGMRVTQHTMLRTNVWQLFRKCWAENEKQLGERSARHGMKLTQDTIHWAAEWQLFRKLLG